MPEDFEKLFKRAGERLRLLPTVQSIREFLGYITSDELNGYATESWVASQGYLTTETDPTVPAHVKAITTSNIADWNAAHGWGNHATAGYVLTSGTYNDPAWLTGLAWSKLTGVPGSFTPAAHTHPLADLTQSGASNGQVPQWNGSAWVPATVSGNNIYNSNGTLTGARALTLGGNTLDFVGSSISTRFFSNGFIGVNRAVNPLGYLHIQKPANDATAHIFLSTPFPSSTPTSIVFQNNDLGGTGIGTGTFSWNTSGDTFTFSHRISVTGDVTSSGNVAVPSGGTYFFGGGEYIRHTGAGSWHIAFHTNNGTERMRLLNNGNLLINTTTDAGFKLDVNGTARVMNELRISDIVISYNSGNRIFEVPNFMDFQVAGISVGGFNSSTWSFRNRNIANAGGLNISNTLASDGTISIQQSASINHLRQWLNIRGIDNASNNHKGTTIRIFGGNASLGFGDIVLAFDGTQKRGNVLIGTEADTSSAILNVASTTQGFLPPRMTMAQFDAISSKAAGLQAYDTTGNGVVWWDGTRTIGFRYNGTKFQGYDGTNWVDLN